MVVPLRTPEGSRAAGDRGDLGDRHELCAARGPLLPPHGAHVDPDAEFSNAEVKLDDGDAMKSPRNLLTLAEREALEIWKMQKENALFFQGKCAFSVKFAFSFRLELPYML